jgi:ribonuclease H2 subunit A
VDFGGHGADSKVLTEAKRDELYASILADSSMGWAVDVIDPRDLSAQMLCRFEKKMT